MNETVKAALLAERENARNAFGYHAREIGTLRRQLAHHEAERDRQERRLDDVNLHLRDNGVDLAAVDAEAGKARPFGSNPAARNAVNLGGQHSIMGQQNGLRQDSLAGVNAGLGQGYGQALSSFGRDSQAANQFDPTAGLAKALDEA